MDTKKDYLSVADELSREVDDVRTLLSAAGDKVTFYLENRALLGPYGPLLYGCAVELENLLYLTQEKLVRLDSGMETVTEHLYRTDMSGAAE